MDRYTNAIAAWFKDIGHVILLLGLLAFVFYASIEDDTQKRNTLKSLTTEVKELKKTNQALQTDLKTTRTQRDNFSAAYDKLSVAYNEAIKPKPVVKRPRATRSSRGVVRKVSVAQPAQRGVARQQSSWRSLVARYFPASAVDRALVIIRRESNTKHFPHGDPNARNGGHYGLFQLAARYHYKGKPATDLYDPELNIKIAARLYAASGNSFSPHWNATNY